MSGSTNAFNVGRDITAIITHPLIGRLDLAHVTGFMVEPEYTTASVKRLDGIKLEQHLPNGWKGEFDVERANAVMDKLCAAIEDGYFNGAPRTYGTLTYYITELDGSTSSYQLSDVTMKFNLGSWKEDAAVKQKLTFNASRRRVV